MTRQEFIRHRLTQRNLIHDLSLGALLTYHKIKDLEAKDKVVYNPNSIVMNKTKSKTDIFIYNDTGVPHDVHMHPQEVRTVINSPVPLPQYKLKSKQKEVVYDLSTIAEHTGKKKYHSYIKPIRIIEQRPDLDIKLHDFEAAGRPSLKAIHDEWVKYKLSLPTTHRITFPTARYRNTIDLDEVPAYQKAIYIRGQLYGFIVFSVENGVAFELSFVSHYWKPEFQILNGLNQYIFSYCLIQLAKQGVSYVNSGFALNKRLSIFKHTSQQAFDVQRYTYEV